MFVLTDVQYKFLNISNSYSSALFEISIDIFWNRYYHFQQTNPFYFNTLTTYCTVCIHTQSMPNNAIWKCPSPYALLKTVNTGLIFCSMQNRTIQPDRNEGPIEWVEIKIIEIKYLIASPTTVTIAIIATHCVRLLFELLSLPHKKHNIFNYVFVCFKY